MVEGTAQLSEKGDSIRIGSSTEDLDIWRGNWRSDQSYMIEPTLFAGKMAEGLLAGLPAWLFGFTKPDKLPISEHQDGRCAYKDQSSASRACQRGIPRHRVLTTGRVLARKVNPLECFGPFQPLKNIIMDMLNILVYLILFTIFLRSCSPWFKDRVYAHVFSLIAAAVSLTWNYL